MDAITSLQNELFKLEQTLKTFKIGAATARQLTVEEKVTEIVKTLTVSGAKLLTAKVKIEEAKQPRDEKPVDDSDLESLLDEYETELAKFVLTQSLGQQSIEASVLHDMRIGQTPVDEETFRFVEESLTEIVNMQFVLHEMMKEEQQVSQQILKKKKELKIADQNYKDKMEEAKTRKQHLASREEAQSLQQKKQIELKLEKVNMMGFLIMNILTMSKVNYQKDPKWVNLLLEVQNPITLQELTSGET